MESQKILCDVCGASFTMNKNLLRHVREKHQGMKRTDNETRKRDVTDNEARKQGILAGLYSETCEAQVESVPQVRSRAPWGANACLSVDSRACVSGWFSRPTLL